MTTCLLPANSPWITQGGSPLPISSPAQYVVSWIEFSSQKNPFFPYTRRTYLSLPTFSLSKEVTLSGRFHHKLSPFKFSIRFNLLYLLVYFTAPCLALAFQPKTSKIVTFFAPTIPPQSQNQRDSPPSSSEATNCTSFHRMMEATIVIIPHKNPQRNEFPSLAPISESERSFAIKNGHSFMANHHTLSHLPITNWHLSAAKPSEHVTLTIRTCHLFPKKTNLINVLQTTQTLKTSLQTYIKRFVSFHECA